MFETNEFRTVLENTISTETARQGLTQFRTEIIETFQKLAADNEPSLMLTENQKTASLRRGVPEALASARELVKEAAAFAKAEDRTTLTLEDMQRALKINFCKVWPFCK